MPDESSLSAEQVHKIANLARLSIGPAEEAQLAREMSGILAYIEKLKELDVTGISATSHAVELPTKLRQDIVRPGLSLDLALGNAPERLGDGFGVPKIIE